MISAHSAAGALRVVVCSCVMVLAATHSVTAQSAPVNRTFLASKAVVEGKLHELGGYSGGKLPILEGFVVPDERLDHYQHGYYQYSVQLTAVAPGKTQVRVSAKITAWYAANTQSRSGYHVLPSNGRLETDFCERLEEALTGRSAGAGSSTDQRDLGTPQAASSIPDSPSAHNPGLAMAPRVSPLVRPLPWGLSSGSGDEQRVKQLREQLKSLDAILKSQAHPDDLAVVKSSNTPILASPLQGAQVVLLADREDEFQILELKQDWVHVRISGLSRGWIQRAHVELPMATGSTLQSDDMSKLAEASFRQSREETSTFPGNWEPLRGKRVKIVWVQPLGDPAQTNRLTYARSVFHKTYSALSEGTSDLAGVVIVFDSKDGGMAAATMPNLQQWQAGHLSDSAFWKRCWFDPADAFTAKQ